MKSVSNTVNESQNIQSKQKCETECRLTRYKNRVQVDGSVEALDAQTFVIVGALDAFDDVDDDDEDDNKHESANDRHHDEHGCNETHHVHVHVHVLKLTNHKHTLQERFHSH